MLVQQRQIKPQNKKKSNNLKNKVKAQRPRRIINQPSNAGAVDYIKSLNDPFTFRGVRLPSMYPAPTQVKTISGILTFSTNSAGYARVYQAAHTGFIGIYNDPTHTETVLGVETILLNGDPDLTGCKLLRLVSGGLKLRSLQSFNTDAGQIQSYMTLLSGVSAPYDVFRDTPYQRIYSKGEVATARYLPVDCSLTELTNRNSVASFPISGWSIGFMITGAPSATYSLQYSFNYEYTSVNNTDLVPHQRGPVGNVEPLLGQIHSNGANPSDSTHDFTSRVSGLGRLFDSLSNGFRAVNNFSSGGILGLLGSGAKFI